MVRAIQAIHAAEPFELAYLPRTPGVQETQKRPQPLQPLPADCDEKSHYCSFLPPKNSS
jgi:hypothetical protein